MRRSCGALVLLIVPSTLFGQRVECPRPAGENAAVALREVEQGPVADSANGWPPYPVLLQQAGVGGSVRVAFTIDTAGVPEPSSIVIERTPNAGFDMGVKRTVAAWRYIPARLCGRPTRVRVRHEFEYRSLPLRRDTLRLYVLFADTTRGQTIGGPTDTLPDGTPHTILDARSGISDNAPVWLDFAMLDSVARDSVEEATLAEVIDHIALLDDSLTRVVCIAGGRGFDSDPKRERLIRLTRPGIAVLPSRRCPPTFASMVYVQGQRPTPPGDDPFRIILRAKRALSRERVLLDVDVEHGTGGTHYRCGVERRGDRWRARCFSLSSWAS